MESHGVLQELRTVLEKYHVGHKEAIETLLVALLCEGHVLLEGYTGLGKTVLAKSFSLAIGGSFSRIQMTPDMLPSDITGTTYYDLQRGEWRVKLGPIFANVVLVDELNRASPRTQAALLEAMQERQVTIEGRTFPLPRPFMVVATMISVYLEGSYELPLGGIDRFAFSVRLEDLKREEELLVLDVADYVEERLPAPILSPERVLQMIGLVRRITVSPEVKGYVVDLVRFVRRQPEVELPPSPRASIWMYRGARARAFIEGRDYVIPDDVKSVAISALRHRIALKPEHVMDGLRPEDVIQRGLETVPVPVTR